MMGPGDDPPELYEHAVYSSRDIWRLDPESSPPPEESQVIGRRSSREATKNQVMMCIVPHIPGRNVLEHTSVHSQDVFSMG